MTSGGKSIGKAAKKLLNHAAGQVSNPKAQKALKQAAVAAPLVAGLGGAVASKIRDWNAQQAFAHQIPLTYGYGTPVYGSPAAGAAFYGFAARQAHAAAGLSGMLGGGFMVGGPFSGQWVGPLFEVPPSTHEQAREQIVGWADVGMRHLLAYYKANLDPSGTGTTLSPKEEAKLFKDLGKLAKAAGKGNPLNAGTSMKHLLKDLEDVRARAEHYGALIPADKRIEDPIVTTHRVIEAHARLGNHVLGQTYMTALGGNYDIRPLSPIGSTLQTELDVSEAVRKLCADRKKAIRAGTWDPADDRAMMKLVKKQSKALAATHAF